MRQDRRDRERMRPGRNGLRTGARRGLAVAGLLIAGIAGPVSEAGAAPLDEVDALTFSEVGPRSPLAPGIAEQRHYSVGSGSVLAGPNGFAYVEGDAAELTVTEVTVEGETSTSVLTLDSPFDRFPLILQVTEDYVLTEDLVYDGGFVNLLSAKPVLVDRATGAVTSAPASDGGSVGLARLSNDSEVLTGGTDTAFWRSVVDGTVTGGADFDDEAFFRNHPAAVQSPDGRFVAVGGSVSDGDEITHTVLVTDTDAGETTAVEVTDCPVQNCDVVVDAIANRNGEPLVFVTLSALDLSLGGVTVVGADRWLLDVAAGTSASSIAASVTSDNGRWAVGREATSGETELDSSRLVVLDLDSGRTRTFDTDLGEPLVVEPVGISNDGRTLRYATRYPCEGVCVRLDQYFGVLELGPVADVTRGPAEDQILRLYRAVFGRISDVGGFSYWMDRYREGESLVSIAAAFAGEPEFTARYGEDPTDAELIDALYRNTLGRAGDAGGVDYWLGRRADGISVAELLVSFADSPENIERTGTRAPISVAEGRVLRLYRAMLGRSPDAGGLEFWVGQYHAGVDLTEMARRFAGEPEFSAIYGTDPTDAELIDAVYRNVLGRAGEASGVAYWNQRMADDLSVAGLFAAFAQSDENVENTGTVR